MKYSFLFILSILIFSCKKEESPQATSTLFEKFIGKYLVCDSIRTTQNGVSTVTIVGKGKGADIVYSSNGTYQIYQQPPIIKNYKYESPDKVYYWSIGGSMSTTQYTRIISIKNNQIHSTDTDNNPSKKVEYYHTAE
jgi:hypothetical protein